ncbi:hypothetical protein [Streptomyces sp. 8L]|uniref:hypothetical protein n=1 Tax=Streptomyces sp. 8L TaxID=2877242 RepID=UPI001CD3CAB1|nr:hypothetical protein [Streptomyces sp. 8L]MCA1223637.1 hypothetical protein [Streptomyces sp. 8L]
MGDGFFHWYRDRWSRADARAVLAALDANGVRRANPGDGRVSLITGGPDSWGEQVATTACGLVEQVAFVDGEVNFQLWVSADTDVFTRVRSPEVGVATVVLEFGLDGLADGELERTAAALLRVVGSHRAGTLGFVLDRAGTTAELDWDAVLAGAAVPVSPLPDTLGLPRAYVPLHPEVTSVVRESVAYGDLVVFDRAGTAPGPAGGTAPASGGRGVAAEGRDEGQGRRQRERDARRGG